MYTKYKNALIKDYGLDFDSFLNVMYSNGNASGIYADVGLLLSKIVASEQVKSVLEFGSGMSTLVLAYMCNKYLVSITTIERMLKWYNITSAGLNNLGLHDSISYICTEDKEDRLPALSEEVSFVWVDGAALKLQTNISGRIGACRHYWPNIKNALILFDDAQLGTWRYMAFLEEMGRKEDTVFMYNPTGRTDRHVLVSFPNNDSLYRDIVMSCCL